MTHYKVTSHYLTYSIIVENFETTSTANINLKMLYPCNELVRFVIICIQHLMYDFYHQLGNISTAIFLHSTGLMTFLMQSA